MSDLPLGLSFDDVLLIPQRSEVLPAEADLSTRLAAEIGTSPCTSGVGVGDAQRALLDYFAGLRVLPPDHRDARRCRTLVAQANHGRLPAFDARGWRESWRGSRPGDRSEAFVLFRRGR